MKRKLRRQVKLILILLCIIIVFLVSKNINFPKEQIINLIPEIIKKDPYKESIGKLKEKFASDYQYNSKSILVREEKYKQIIYEKNSQEQFVPASLTKLFVIDYALSLVDLNDNVKVTWPVLNLPKKNSSLAKLKPGTYTVKTLIAGMLIPSGNDASYALSDYCALNLNSELKTVSLRQEEFIKHLNIYLKNSGYLQTEIYDASGYDLNNKTTSKDLSLLMTKLLKNNWFREMVNSQTMTINNLSWQNTNALLDPGSKHYNPNVKGIKTGSLSKRHSLVTLIENEGFEYLIISLEAEDDENRYLDTRYIIDKITEKAE